MTIEEALNIIDGWLDGNICSTSPRLEEAMTLFEKMTARIEAQAIRLAQKQLRRETCTH